MIFVEFQRGKEGIKHSKYNRDIGTTAACTKRMMNSTKGVYQKSIKGGRRIVSFLIVGSPPKRRQNL